MNVNGRRHQRLRRQQRSVTRRQRRRIVDMTQEIWYNRDVGVATHHKSSNQGSYRTDSTGAAPLHNKKGLASPISLIAERGRRPLGRSFAFRRQS